MRNKRPFTWNMQNDKEAVGQVFSRIPEQGPHKSRDSTCVPLPALRQGTTPAAIIVVVVVVVGLSIVRERVAAEFDSAPRSPNDNADSAGLGEALQIASGFGAAPGGKKHSR
uniref:Transmembrane protein n=1 Tax=Panagrellus redivivus TaxID=6233 RepID=A0A7E4V313_PANRE